MSEQDLTSEPAGANLPSSRPRMLALALSLLASLCSAPTLASAGTTEPTPMIDEGTTTTVIRGASVVDMVIDVDSGEVFYALPGAPMTPLDGVLEIVFDGQPSVDLRLMFPSGDYTVEVSPEGEATELHKTRQSELTLTLDPPSEPALTQEWLLDFYGPGGSELPSAPTVRVKTSKSNPTAPLDG